MYRLLLADDDLNIREGLAAFIAADFPDIEVVAMAKDGREALELAEKIRPEIIITDINMPKLSGLDLISQLLDAMPESRFIIISGYDDFQYAHRALKLGVDSYLLKPLDTDELKREIDRTCLLIRQDLERNAGLDRDHEIHQFIDSAIMGEKRNLKLLSKSQQERVQEIRYYCCVLSQSPASRQVINNLLRVMDWPVDTSVHTASVGEHLKCTTLYTSSAHKDQFFLSITHNFTQLGGELDQKYDLVVKSYRGSIVNEIEKVAVSFQTARLTMQAVFSDSAGTINSYDDYMNELMERSRYPYAIRRLLLQSASVDDWEQVNKQFDDFLDWFQLNGVNDAKFISIAVTGLSYQLVEQTVEKGFDFSQYEYINVAHELDRAGNLDEIRTIVHDLATVLQLSKRRNVLSISGQIKRAIDRNYSDSTYSIDQFAGEVFLSPGYLREIFKRETGHTFSEYLLNRRLEEACKFLNSPEVRIGQVAEWVGFNDQRYFSSCFKKAFGVTPSEYQLSAHISEN